MYMRRFRPLIIAGIALSLFAACGGTDSDAEGNAGNPQGSDEPVEITDSSEIWLLGQGPETLTFDILNTLLDSIFNTIEITYEKRVVAAGRSISLLSEGEFDMEMARTAGMEERFANILRVPEPIYNIDLTFFTHADHEPIGSIRDLDDELIAVVSNARRVIADTAEMNRIITDTPSEAMQMLDQGRVDAVIQAKYNGMYIIKDLGLEGIVVHQEPFFSTALYSYISTDHSDRLEQITEAVRMLKESGEYERIVTEKTSALDELVPTIPAPQ